MNTNRQTFLDDLGATAALLAGVSRVHNNQLATSFFHFVCHQLGEQLQACIVRGERKDATCADPISTLSYRTIVLNHFQKVKRKNEGRRNGLRRFQIPLSPKDDSPLWR